MSAFSDLFNDLAAPPEAAGRPNEITPTSPLPPATPSSAFQDMARDISLSPEALRERLPAPPEPMIWQLGRGAFTAASRGMGNTLDAVTDPLSPFRALISPEYERAEQSVRFHPGQSLSDASFGFYGVPEMKPETSGGRMALSTAAGAVGGAPFGIGGAMLGAASGAAGQGAGELGYGERMQTAASMLPGGLATAGAPVVNSARGRVAPQFDTLTAAGVRPTIGQMFGGTLNSMEQKATSVPFVGDSIRNARNDTMRQFRQGAYDQALEPGGMALPRGTPLDRTAVDDAHILASDNYNRIVPGLTLSLDPQLHADISAAINSTRGLLPDQRNQFRTLLNDELMSRLDPQSGTLTGQNFKDAESTIGTFARNYRNSSNPDQRTLGMAAQDLQTALREALVRSSGPADAAALRGANETWAHLLRVQNAAGQPGVVNGEFTPTNLLSAVRQMDPSLRKGQYARGNALMQDYAEAGRSMLGNTVPDSGTAGRSFLGALFGASNPMLALKIAAAGVPISALYSPAGRAASTWLMQPGGYGAPMSIGGVVGTGLEQQEQRRRGLIP